MTQDKQGFLVAVTSPEGLTKCVGHTIAWANGLNSYERLEFCSREYAQEHIDNPWTAANGRKAAGWKVEIVEAPILPPRRVFG
jgi:hypothetical protein